MKTVLALSMVSVLACAEVKPVARTVNDVARQACEVAFGAQELPQGITVKDLCEKQEDLQPFINSILAAQQQVGATHGVK